ncbi:MAG: hypothetical protein WD378_00370 [Egicoccus sp.]
MRGVVDALPDGTHVGLRVYGHREPNTDEERGCQDSELVGPVQPLDRDAMRTAIDEFQPSGFTPIGLSLREAAGDLPPEGRARSSWSPTARTRVRRPARATSPQPCAAPASTW